MAYKSNNFLFRSLTDEEEGEFRAYARKNYEPNPGKKDRYGFTPHAAVHHPVIIDECAIMDKEFAEAKAKEALGPPFGKAEVK